LFKKKIKRILDIDIDKNYVNAAKALFTAHNNFEIKLFNFYEYAQQSKKGE